MKPTITLLIGAPLTGEEARFLRRLHADLDGIDALILANFETPRRQIDFVVITATYAALLELKNFPRPIFGQQNGVWMYENSGGQRLRYAGENPWQQALAEKFALSDEMVKFQRNHTEVPQAGGRGYFTQFDGFVCIFPEIHRDSNVTRGDHKVAIASYPEALEAIRTKNISSAWSLRDWEKFAERHLNLSKTTLDQATSPAINEASEKLRAYRDRLGTVMGTGLPPLFSRAGEASCGQELVDQLLEPRNVMLLGPSGSTKTFHLHHLLLAIVSKGDELPLLIEPKRYRGGDFWTVLRHGTAPFFRGDPRDLLEAARLCGLMPVLVVDALNECGEALIDDLLRGVQSFIVQFGGRVIFSSQAPIELPGDIVAESRNLSLPNEAQKRAIYAFHAGVPASSELDNFCSGFTNAYDLTIAGRCHTATATPVSRTDLYDRYVRRCVPESPAIATGLLRAVASEMSAKFSLALTRDEFETIAEQFLSQQKASLGIIDQLRASRLIQLTDEGFTFEHEQLFDYFKAEVLRRQFKDAKQLAAELRKPRHQDLIELILPRFSAAEDLRELLSAAQDARLLSRVLHGTCGPLPLKELVALCESLLEDAAQDLPNLQIQCQSIDAEDGRKRLTGLELVGHREWGTFSALLCHTIALSIDNPLLQGRFLELLDLTEWTLRIAAQEAAKASRFRPNPVWAEVVRLYGGGLQHGTVRIPCCTILSTLRMIQMFPRHFKRGLPISEQLWERVCRTPESHFSMLALLEDAQRGEGKLDLRRVLTLAKQGCESDVYMLKVDGLELLQRISREVQERAPEELPAIRALLESFDNNNIMLNTSILEALAAYEFLEPAVTPEAALAELRAVIAAKAPFDAAMLELASLTETSPEQMLSDRAYGLLSNIFEDVFQGVYYEAYTSLSDDEKRIILCWAANASTPGFFTDWVLRELFQHGGEAALPIYERFASGPDGDSFSAQEAVATFALGVQGCAKLGGVLPTFDEGESSAIRAWRTIGEILFLCAQNLPIPETLWDRFTGDVGPAAADVLYQLQHSQWRVAEQQKSIDLVATFQQHVCPIFEECLRHRDSLPSIFRHGGSQDSSVVRFLISSLGEIGRVESVLVLKAVVDDQIFGRDAIASIEAIQRRLSPVRLLATS
jgi:hypothetical protein